MNLKEVVITMSKQLAAFADDADLIGRGTLSVNESFVERTKPRKLHWTDNKDQGLDKT